MTANLTSATPANQTSVTEGIPAEVMEHLHRHHVITLSTTSFTGMPHADTVVYMSDARSIFFFAGAETQMLRNIKDSRRVSFTIDDYTTDWRKVRELQGVGRCLPVRAEQDAEAWSLYLSKFGPEAARPPGFMHAIVPNEMHFVDYNYAKVAGRTTQIRRTFQIDNRAAAGARCGLDQPRPAGLRARPDRLPSGRLGRGVLRRSLIRRAAVSAGVTALVLGASAGAAAASTGTAAALAFTPATHNYRQVMTGQAAVQTFTLANSGGSASGTLKLRLAGSAQFTLTADTCAGISLKPGKSCTVTVQFAPASAGKATATLTAAQGTTVLATGTLSGTGVAPGHLYWTTSSTVMAANLNGTGATILASGQALPAGVTVDNGHLYWTSLGEIVGTGTITEANLTGTGATTLASAQDNPMGVAVAGGHLYWANFFDPNFDPNSGTIMEANLNGTGATTLISGQNEPDGLAVYGSHLYSASYGDGTIMEANLNGTGVSTLVSGQNQPGGLAVSGGHIYWADSSAGTIMEASLNGTGVTTLVSGQNGPVGVAADSSHIYWANGNAGTIMEASLNGTGVTTLASGQNSPSGVTLGP